MAIRMNFRLYRSAVAWASVWRLATLCFRGFCPALQRSPREQRLRSKRLPHSQFLSLYTLAFMRSTTAPQQHARLLEKASYKCCTCGEINSLVCTDATRASVRRKPFLPLPIAGYHYGGASEIRVFDSGTLPRAPPTTTAFPQLSEEANTNIDKDIAQWSSPTPHFRRYCCRTFSNSYFKSVRCPSR